MLTTNCNHLEMFGSPNCLLDIDPSTINNSPIYNFFSKNTSPLIIMSPYNLVTKRKGGGAAERFDAQNLRLVTATHNTDKSNNCKQNRILVCISYQHQRSDFAVIEFPRPLLFSPLRDSQKKA